MIEYVENIRVCSSAQFTAHKVKYIYWYNGIVYIMINEKPEYSRINR